MNVRALFIVATLFLSVSQITAGDLVCLSEDPHASVRANEESNSSLDCLNPLDPPSGHATAFPRECRNNKPKSPSSYFPREQKMERPVSPQEPLGYIDRG